MTSDFPIVIESEHAPISTNMLFFNVAKRGRVTTDRYKTWKNAVGYDFNGKGSIEGPFLISVTLNAKKRRKGSDIDNKIKCLMDMLVAHQIVSDDSLCEEVHIRYGTCSKAFRLEVWHARQQL